MLFAVVKQLRRRHRRPPLGSPLSRLGLPALLAVLLDQGCSPGSPTMIPPASPRTRSREPATATTLLWVLFAGGRCAGCLPRARGAARPRHGPGTRVAGSLLIWEALRVPRSLRRSSSLTLGTTCAEFAGVAIGLELAGCQPLSLGAGRCSTCRLRRPAGQLPPHRARPTAAHDHVRRLRRRGPARTARLEGSRAWPRCPQSAAQSRRADRGRGHRRHHARAMGTCTSSSPTRLTNA